MNKETTQLALAALTSMYAKRKSPVMAPASKQSQMKKDYDKALQEQKQKNH